MKKNSKTNVCRILDRQKIQYQFVVREETQEFEELGIDSNICFKTLVLEGSDKNHYVCVIPIDAHLDLKKASRHFQLKSIKMILQKDLEPLTGYVHGGCSPVGMKTKFKTAFDIRAKDMEKFLVSAGKVRNSIIVNPIEFADFCDADFADLVAE